MPYFGASRRSAVPCRSLRNPSWSTSQASYAASNERAKLAIDIFVEGVRNYIGAYALQLGGVDAIAFTAGIGENDAQTRKEILEGLEFLGIELDEEKNRKSLENIEKDSSRVKVFVIRADEESVVADNAYKLITGEGK